MSSSPNNEGLRKATIAAVAGTIIEWYDYALYGAAAGLIIGPLFFPQSIATAGSMAAFATFAVGFVVRPLGGVVVGHIGDKYGRRPAMILSLVLMGAATIGIGLLPTALAVGIWAPILLIVMRLLQGFGAGAELAGAMTLVAEYAPDKRRGFFTSLVLAAPPVGILLATVIFFFAASLPKGAFLDWAWRVPFLLSAALFVVAMYIRNHLDETPSYQAVMARAEKEAKEQKVPLMELFHNNKSGVALGFFALTGHNALNYILAAFSLSFMTSPSVGLTSAQALIAVSLGSIFGIISTPIGGLATDRFGAAYVLAFGGLMGTLLAYPIFMLLGSGSTWLATLGVALGYLVVIGATGGSQGAFLANLFPANYRYSGIAVAREINGSIVAGFTPLIALALIQAAGGGIRYAAGYLALCCFSSFVAVIVARGRGNRVIS